MNQTVRPGAGATADDRAAAASAARSRREPLLAYLEELMRTPSDNPPGDCRLAAQRAVEEFESLGLTVERHEVDWPDGPCPVPIVLAWLGPRTTEPALLLNAHLDTSPPGDGWSSDPHEPVRREGRIFGRGATVSKSDVAAYTYALAAAATTRGEKTVVAAITADEGSGGHRGPRYLLEHLGVRPARAICAGFTHAVTTAHNGCVQIRARLRGRATHTALSEPGTETMRLVSLLAARVVAHDDALRARPSTVPGIESPTISITRIAGGEFFGMAPGSAEIWIDRRVPPGDDQAAALADVEGLVARFAEEFGADIELSVATVAEPLLARYPEWATEVQREAEAVLQREVPLRAVPLYTDARWFDTYGVPTVMYGAGADDLRSAGVNGPDENVSVDDVCTACEVVARVVATARSLR